MSSGANTQQARTHSQQIDRDHQNELNSLKQRHLQEIQQLDERRRRTKQQVGDAYLQDMMVKKREQQDTRAVLSREEQDMNRTSQQLDSYKSDLENKNKTLSGHKVQIRKYMGNLEKVYRDKEKSIEAIREHIEKQEAIIRQSDEAKRNALARIEEAKLAIQSEGAKSQTAEEQLVTTNIDLDSVIQHLSDNEAILVQTQTNINKLKNDLKQTKSREKSVEKQIGKISDDIDNTNKDIDRYNETMATNEQSIVEAENKLEAAKSVNDGSREDRRSRIDQAGIRIKQLHNQSNEIGGYITSATNMLKRYATDDVRSHHTLQQIQNASAAVNKSLSAASNSYDVYMGVRDDLSSRRAALSNETRILREAKDANMKAAQIHVRNIRERNSDIYVLNNARTSATQNIKNSNEDENMHRLEMNAADIDRGRLKLQEDDTDREIGEIENYLARHQIALSKHEGEKKEFRRVSDDHTQYERSHDDEMNTVAKEFET